MISTIGSRSGRWQLYLGSKLLEDSTSLCPPLCAPSQAAGLPATVKLPIGAPAAGTLVLCTHRAILIAQREKLMHVTGQEEALLAGVSENFIGEKGLVDLAVVDFLFNSAAGDESIDSDLSCLTDAPCTLTCLAKRDGMDNSIGVFNQRQPLLVAQVHA